MGDKPTHLWASSHPPLCCHRLIDPMTWKFPPCPSAATGVGFVHSSRSIIKTILTGLFATLCVEEMTLEEDFSFSLPHSLRCIRILSIYLSIYLYVYNRIRFGLKERISFRPARKDNQNHSFPAPYGPVGSSAWPWFFCFLGNRRNVLGKTGGVLEDKCKQRRLQEKWKRQKRVAARKKNKNPIVFNRSERRSTFQKEDDGKKRTRLVNNNDDKIDRYIV